MKKYKILNLVFAITLLTFILTSCFNGSDSLFKSKKDDKSDLSESLKPIENFDLYTTKLSTKMIKSSPIDATFLFGNLEALGMEDLLSELDDFSYESYKSDLEEAKNILNELNSLDYDDLTDEQKLTYDIIKFHTELAIEGEQFYYYHNEIQPTSGAQINIPLALMQIEFDTEEEAKAYLTRLEQLPRLFEQILQYEQERAKQGLLMPEYLYDLVIEQIDGILVEPENFMMYLSFCDKIDKINIDESKKEEYKNQCLEIVKNKIYPAYDSLKIGIEEYKTYANDDYGVGSWKNGKEYYEYIVKSETSYNMDVEELKDWATDNFLNSITTIQDIYDANPELLEIYDFSSLLPTYNSLDELYAIQDKCLDEYFYDYDIEPASENIIPEYLEDYMAQGFYFPISIDGEDYGNMYLQKNAYEHIDSSTLELYFHENIPGHHLYFSTVYNSDLPLIRKLYSWLPYEEGWAQYIQKLSIKYYGLEDDTLTRLLEVNSDISYYYMVLMDIKFHYEGASKEEIINSYIEIGSTREGAEDIVNRMIANPGEIIHYVYGGYKMQSYLEECQNSLKDKFNIKDFHHMILNNGSVPFVLMDEVVEDYIDEHK